MINLFFQLGSLPTPPPPESSGFSSVAIPFLIAGSAMLAMLLSVVLRYNARFRDWWEANVCGWMEEHVVKSDEMKGGR